MANDFLGNSDSDSATTVNDYLGVPSPLAFEGKSALPAGGPIVGGAAPATEGGEGMVGVPGISVAGGGDSGGPAQAEVNRALQAYGLSRKALDSYDWAQRLFGGADSPTLPQTSGQIAPDFPLAEGMPSQFSATQGSLTPGEAALAAEAEGGSIAAGEAAGAGFGAVGGAEGAAAAEAGMTSAQIAEMLAPLESTGYGLLAAVVLEDLLRMGMQGPESAQTPVVGDAIRGISRLSNGDERGLYSLMPGAAFAEDLSTQGVRAVPLVGNYLANMAGETDPETAFRKAKEKYEIGQNFTGAVSNFADVPTLLSRVQAGELSLEDANRLAARAGGGAQALSSYYGEFGTPDALAQPVEIAPGVSFPSMSQYLSALDLLTTMRTSDAITRSGGTAPSTLSPGQAGLLLNYAGDQFTQDANASPYTGPNPYYQGGAIDPGFASRFVPGSAEEALVEYATRVNPQFAGTPLAALLGRAPSLTEPQQGQAPAGEPARPDTKALEQLAAFGLLPGGGAGGEALLES